MPRYLKCEIGPACDSSDIIETVAFLSSISINWKKDSYGIYNEKLYIELIDTPDILKIDRLLHVLKITDLGISFYFINFNFGENAEFESGADGIMFCPMSNVKSINTFGEISDLQSDHKNIDKFKY